MTDPNQQMPPYPGAEQPMPPPMSPGQPPAYPEAPPYPGAASPEFPVPAAPPGAYGVPVGGYQAPVGGYAVPPATPAKSRSMGAIALVASLVAAIVVPIIAGVIAFQIGTLVPTADLISTANDSNSDLSFLSPARTQVLWAEITFWVGTALGIFALVFGIMATAKRRGRGMGITAIVLSVLGPGIFFVAVSIFMGIGAAVAAPGSF